MLSTPDFQKWGNSNDVVLFASVMTRIEGRKDDDLLRTYGHRGFPSLSVLDAEGTMLLQRMGRDTFSMQSAVLAADGLAKREAGKELSDKEAFLTDLRIGKIESDQLETRMAELGDVEWTEAEQAEVKGHQAVAKLGSVMSNPDNRPGNPGHEKAKEFVYEAYKAGNGVPQSHSMAPRLEKMAAEVAMAKGDNGLFSKLKSRVIGHLQMEIKDGEFNLERANGLLERYKDNEQYLPRVQAMIKRTEDSLAETKAMLEKVNTFGPGTNK